jgi:hypothetical protein
MKLHSQSHLITNSSNTTYIFATPEGGKRLKEMLSSFLSKMGAAKTDFEVEVVKTRNDNRFDYFRDELSDFAEKATEYDDKTHFIIDEGLGTDGRWGRQLIEDFENGVYPPESGVFRLLTEFFKDFNPSDDWETNYFDYDYVIKFPDGTSLPVGDYHNHESSYNG